MNHIPEHYRQFMPGVFLNRTEQFAGINGFDGLDGFGKKLKKAVKKAAAPIKKVAQKVAKKDPLIKAVKKVADPVIKKGYREVSRIGKNKVFQIAASALMPIAAAPGLLDKTFRKNTAPVYAAYGVAAGAAGAGFAAGGAGDAIASIAEEVSNGGLDTFTGGSFTGGGGGGGGGGSYDMPWALEEPQAEEATEEKSNPIVPLGIVGLALSLLR